MICIIFREIWKVETEYGKKRIYKIRFKEEILDKWKSTFGAYIYVKIGLDPGLEVILVEQDLNLKVQSLEDSSQSLKINQ